MNWHNLIVFYVFTNLIALICFISTRIIEKITDKHSDSSIFGAIMSFVVAIDCLSLVLLTGYGIYSCVDKLVTLVV